MLFCTVLVFFFSLFSCRGFLSNINDSSSMYLDVKSSKIMATGVTEGKTLSYLVAACIHLSSCCLFWAQCCASALCWRLRLRPLRDSECFVQSSPALEPSGRAAPRSASHRTLGRNARPRAEGGARSRGRGRAGGGERARVPAETQPPEPAARMHAAALRHAAAALPALRGRRCGPWPRGGSSAPSSSRSSPAAGDGGSRRRPEGPAAGGGRRPTPAEGGWVAPGSVPLRLRWGGAAVRGRGAAEPAVRLLRGSAPGPRPGGTAAFPAGTRSGTFPPSVAGTCRW